MHDLKFKCFLFITQAFGLLNHIPSHLNTTVHYSKTMGSNWYLIFTNPMIICLKNMVKEPCYCKIRKTVMLKHFVLFMIINFMALVFILFCYLNCLPLIWIDIVLFDFPRMRNAKCLIFLIDNIIVEGKVICIPDSISFAVSA
jgi:hypothetical protein